MRESTHETCNVLPFLVQAIEEHEIETPELMDLGRWHTWRAGAGGQPKLALDGFTTSLNQEKRLWKQVMSNIYGLGWQKDLRENMSLPPPRRQDYTIPKPVRKHKILVQNFPSIVLARVPPQQREL